MSKPNLFIVGSMKCGTTILYDFLTSHDQVGRGAEKEIHFFSLYFDKGADWYGEKFADSGEKQYLLDASPTYLDMCLSVPTAERIRDFCPDAKIIILTRNPAARAVSHFNHLKKINKLKVLENLSFDEFISGVAPRAEDQAELKGLRDMVVGFSIYQPKIRKFVEIFGHENVLLVQNEDLRAHGPAVVHQIFEFLGLETPQGVDFSQRLYEHGSDRIHVEGRNYIKLLDELGDDYYHVCRTLDVRRVIGTDPGVVLNQPVGALVDDVGVGEDGWLFLASGSNNVVEMYLESEAEQAQVVSTWHDAVRERKSRLAEAGIRYLHGMIPEKMTVLGEKLHWPLETARSRGAAFFQMAPLDIRGNLIDVVGYFLRLPSKADLFYKTDSHWTHVGAFVAYQLICATQGFSIRNELLGRPKAHGELVMDLGGKLPDRPSEDAAFINYRKDARIVSDAGLVRFKRENHLENEGALHVGSFIEFEFPEAPNAQTIMIFGDSFCEYRDHLLTALFAETFRHTIFIWSSGIDYEACARMKPDIVLCLMTERFMSRPPNDQFNFERHAETALAAWKATGRT